jgi:poly(3-hydroxybutyrate) depolymerase
MWEQIAYTHNIISAVKSNMNIDSKRIYAVGHSNGGGFVNLLACTASTAPLFGAFATSSAALYSGTKSMSGCDSGGSPIAIIDFHGIADEQIPYAGRASKDGDTSYALPHIDAWRQSWAQRAGCSAPSNANALMAPSTVTTKYAGKNATSYRWDCPKATVIGYTAQSMGHFWLTKEGGYWDMTPVNIVNFFNAHPLGQPT